MLVERSGLSMAVFTPQTKRELDWLSNNVGAEPWQWQGGSFCIEFRFAPDLLAALQAEGFTCKGSCLRTIRR
jgi:hypothetical protein